MTNKQNSESQQPVVEVPEDLKEFFRQLLVAKGADTLPSEIQARAMYDLFTRFNMFLLTNIAKALPPEKQDEFGDLAESGASQQQIEEYIQNAGLDKKKIVSETLDEFKATFLGEKMAEGPKPVEDGTTA